DLLGHGVLDLQAGVDLEEGHGHVSADQELARARADVAGLAQDRDRGLVEHLLLLGRQERCGGLLDELLVAALERAVARRDDDDVPVRVREALRLDVAGPVEEALDEALPSAEGRRRLTDRGLVELVDLVRLARYP